ncbi:DinB superfamily protein [Salegentibacter echinorum]|uniref:DinB superfamily protein n=1 Tax=Salegentibacter echinorum TaxID=1073325 RepID=A0A1M5G894_SALEC|nr:DinB family protein [Salegentibacter echinorum]SHF99965.1 DinB superfamily protein [Salegentibacter echinorum]
MKTQEFIDRVEELSIKFSREFGHCDLATLNFKPDEKSWSIAQILAHLIKVNESYFPLFTQLQEGKYSLPVTGRIGFVVNFFGKTLLKSVQPETKKKSSTVPGWKPAKETFSEEILIEFNEVQEALKNHIENSEVLLHQKAIISSPANKFIVYRLETAFQILVAHEERHFQQAKRVLEIEQSHL